MAARGAAMDDCVVTRLAGAAEIGLALVLAGCGSSAPLGGEGTAASPTAPAPSGSAAVAAAPPPRVPLSRTAELAALTMQTPVYARPQRDATKLGYLRLGARTARSEQPVPGSGCRGAWYAVAPRGFACAGRDTATRDGLDEATVDLAHPLLRAFARTPELTRPLPYPYAFVRAASALYLQVPSKKEQDRFEMGLSKHLAAWSAHGKEWNHLDSGGANAVPLDEEGVALTAPEAPPPPPPDASDHDLYGGGASDDVPWYLHFTRVAGNKARFDRDVPNVSPYVAPGYAVLGGRAARHAGLSLAGTFVAGPEAGGRRFAVTIDGRLAPADKLKPHVASAFHGVRVDGDAVKLPIAFVTRRGARAYSETPGRSKWKKGDELTYRSVIALTGRDRMYPTVRYLETTDGRWLDIADVAYVEKPEKLPSEFDATATKWLDVSIWHQTMVAYEGATPVYATLVSTGIDGMDDPRTTKSTVRGAFRIDSKHVTATMDADDADNQFELRDVPWVQFFEQGYALHAAYWHDDFGKPRSHGCVNLSPIDAHWLFFWTDPDLPVAWHGVRAGVAGLAPGTWVRVHG